MEKKHMGYIFLAGGLLCIVAAFIRARRTMSSAPFNDNNPATGTGYGTSRDTARPIDYGRSD